MLVLYVLAGLQIACMLAIAAHRTGGWPSFGAVKELALGAFLLWVANSQTTSPAWIAWLMVAVAALALLAALGSAGSVLKADASVLNEN